MNSTEVLEANKRFYDQIASVYEQADSRRADHVDHSWIDPLLQSFNPAQKPLKFLDAGSGSGFLSLKAQHFFQDLTLVDISQKMLDRIPLKSASKICADCSHIPLPDQSFDVIGAFATLHHLFDPKDFFRETHRLLKPGGILYTDHDIEKHFIQHFGIPLRAYRWFFDHGPKYLKLCPEARKDDYFTSEFHGQRGLDVNVLADQLKALGFEVETKLCHWEGMGPVAKTLSQLKLQKPLTRKGFAPVLRLIARKKNS